MSEFEYLVEWKVRRISLPSKEPKETYESRIKSWALASLGVGENEQTIYKFIEEKKMATIEDLSKHLNEPPETVQESLDLLYSIGIVDRLGKAFYIGEPLSSSIVRRLIPRVTEGLRNVASVESKARVGLGQLRSLEGRAFGSVKEAIPALGEAKRSGSNCTVRFVGTQCDSGEAVEVEGPVIDLDYGNQTITVITKSGEKIVVGGRHSDSVDVRAHTIIVKGD